MKHWTADPAFFDCRRCACAGLRRVSRAVTMHYERAFVGSGLRSTQFSLLALLTQTGPLAVSKLARHLGLERTTLTRNLRLLEEKGWVRVKQEEGDQRVRRIEMTRAGRAAAEKGLVAWRKAQGGLGKVLRSYGVENLLGAIGK